MTKFKLAYIQWADHYGASDSTWKHYDLDDMTKNNMGNPINSVGWVISENKTMVSLLPHVDTWNTEADRVTGFGIINIIKSCILKRKNINLNDKRTNRNKTKRTSIQVPEPDLRVVPEREAQPSPSLGVSTYQPSVHEQLS